MIRRAEAIVLALMVSVAPARTQTARPGASFGDSTFAAGIDRELRTIYDATRPGRAVLIGDNPLAVDRAIGTELRGLVTPGGGLVRALADVWTELGKYSAEYFFAGDTLVFVFETYSYREDAPAAASTRNFWGLRSWERRSYFRRSGEVGFSATVGDGGPAPGGDGARLRAQAARVRALLGAHTAP